MVFENNKGGFYLVYIFRRARTSTDRLIDMLTGDKEVHVDVGLFRDSSDGTACDTNKYVFSAYVKQSLSKTCVETNNYFRDYDSVYLLPISQTGFDTVLVYLNHLVEQAMPYNYKDLFLCVVPHPIGTWVKDVDVYNVKSVYCSQLGVLTLKLAAGDELFDNNLNESIGSLHSRCTSPSQLLSFIRDYATPVNLCKYCIGVLEVQKSLNGFGCSLLT
jgi:hypothetical protein